MTTVELIHPSIPTGSEKQRRAHVLSTATGSAIIVLILFILYYSIFDRSYNIVPMAALCAICILTFVINKQGKTQTASHIVVWAMLCGVVILAYINEGLSDTALQAFPAILIVVALMFEKRYLIFVSIFCLVAIITLGVLEVNHFTPFRAALSTPYTHVFDIILIEGATVIIAMLVSSYLHEGLRREQLEKIALFESEERFRNLFENAPIGVFYSTIGGKILMVNNEYAKILGYASPGDAKAFINQSSITEAVYAESDERSKLIARAAAAQGKWIKTEQLFRRKNGSTITANLMIRILPSDPHLVEGFVEDVTQRNEAAKALRSSEDKYRLLVENQNDLVVKVNGNGEFLYVSPSYCTMFGKSEAELIGKSFLPLVHAEDIESTKKEMKKLTQAPYTCYIEQRAMTKDGWRWFSWSDSAEVTNNDITSIIGVGRDISDRKHAEDALQNKERYQRAMLDNFPFAVWLKDTESRFLAVNKLFAKTFNARSTDELVGKNDYDIVPPDVAETYRADDRAVLESRSQKNAEEQIIGQDQLKWFETFKAPVIDVNGETLGTVGFMRDITERKQMEDALRQSEVRLREAQRIGKMGSLDWNLETNVITLSEESAIIFGFDKKTRVVPADEIMNVMHPDDRDRVAQGLNLAITKNIAFNLDHHVIRPDGNVVAVRATAELIHNQDRKPVRLLGTILDITERMATEQLLRDMQRRESIGVLSGGIAHDFNNLLGAMMGNISLAQTQLPPGHAAVKTMERALAAMDRAASLTKQILAYSGKGKFQFSPTDVGAMIREHESLFTVSLPKNVKLETHIPLDPLYVNGDPGQLEQILMNLIINGGEAFGEKYGAVSVTLSAVNFGRDQLGEYSRLTKVPLDGGTYAQLDVSDTGVGMSRSTMNTIFDPFFTTKFTGRGMGLSAVLGIVQGHKGGITVESVEGAGTTFRIILPVIDTHVPVQGKETDTAQSATVITKTILVIDDEPTIAEMAKDLLETEQYTVLTELNPVRGIELYEQHRYEIGLVLLDLTMPEMSGKEVVDALQAIDPNVKIIITSGYSAEEVTKKIGMAKVSGFIQKPYRLQSLISLVQTVSQ